MDGGPCSVDALPSPFLAAYVVPDIPGAKTDGGVELGPEVNVNEERVPPDSHLTQATQMPPLLGLDDGSADGCDRPPPQKVRNTTADFSMEVYSGSKGLHSTCLSLSLFSGSEKVTLHNLSDSSKVKHVSADQAANHAAVVNVFQWMTDAGMGEKGVRGGSLMPTRPKEDEDADYAVVSLAKLLNYNEGQLKSLKAKVKSRKAKSETWSKDVFDENIRKLGTLE